MISMTKSAACGNAIAVLMLTGLLQWLLHATNAAAHSAAAATPPLPPPPTAAGRPSTATVTRPPLPLALRMPSPNAQIINGATYPPMLATTFQPRPARGITTATAEVTTSNGITLISQHYPDANAHSAGLATKPTATTTTTDWSTTSPRAAAGSRTTTAVDTPTLDDNNTTMEEDNNSTRATTMASAAHNISRSSSAAEGELSFHQYCIVHRNSFASLFTFTLYTAVCVVGLFGNTLVIYVVLRYAKMQTVTNIYILNLAIADECFLVGIPFLLYTMRICSWKFGDYMCKAYMVSTSITQFTSSIFLLIMSADRYLAVCHPIVSPRYRTLANAKFISAVAWLTSAVLMLPMILYASTVQQEDGVHLSCNVEWPEARTTQSGSTFILYTFILGFATPLSFILMFYLLVVRKLQAVGFKHKSKERKRSHRKVTRLVLTVIAVYVLCWLPHWISQVVLTSSNPTPHDLTRLEIFIFLLVGCLSYSNSAMNPILYAFLSDNFRKSFSKAFSCMAKHDVNAQLQHEPSTLTKQGSRRPGAGGGGATVGGRGRAGDEGRGGGRGRASRGSLRLLGSGSPPGGGGDGSKVLAAAAATCANNNSSTTNSSTTTTATEKAHSCGAATRSISPSPLMLRAANVIGVEQQAEKPKQQHFGEYAVITHHYGRAPSLARTASTTTTTTAPAEDVILMLDKDEQPVSAIAERPPPHNANAAALSMRQTEF